MRFFLKRLFFVLIFFVVFSGNADAQRSVINACKSQTKMAAMKAKAMKEKSSSKKDANAISESCCQWNATYAECYLHPKTRNEALLSSKDGYANIVGRMLKCDESFDRKTCNSHSFCGWFREVEKCVFIDFITGFQDSPCFHNAPSVFTTRTASYDCFSTQSKRMCENDPACYWDELFGLGCLPDIYTIFAGFSFSDYIKATIYKSELIFDNFEHEFDVSDPDFDHSSILEWEIPETECPDEISQRACDVVDAVSEEIFPDSYYCLYKYSDYYQASQCNADPICEFYETDGTCSPKDFLSRSVKLIYKKMESFTKKDGDKAFLSLVSNCTAFTKNTCPETCKWLEIDFCTPLEKDINEVLVVDDYGNDGLCTYLDTLGKTECGDLNKRRQCLKNDICHWDTIAQDCGVSYSYAVNIAVEQDLKLKKKLWSSRSHMFRTRNEENMQDGHHLV